MSTRGAGIVACRRLLAAALLVVVHGATGAEGGREIHGENDAFVVDGVAIAWAVQRAAKPEEATVVLRIARDAARHPALAVVAVDPFGGGTRVVRAPGPAPATTDVAGGRARFGDYPRTEVRLYATASPGPADRPALTIFYQGLPDTTPEFDSEAKLRAWLDQRIAGLRAKAKGGSP